MATIKWELSKNSGIKEPTESDIYLWGNSLHKASESSSTKCCGAINSKAHGANWDELRAFISRLATDSLQRRVWGDQPQALKRGSL